MVAQDRKVLVACLLQLALVLVQPAEVVLCRDAARVILIGALEGTHLDGVAVCLLRVVELAQAVPDRAQVVPNLGGHRAHLLDETGRLFVRFVRVRELPGQPLLQLGQLEPHGRIRGIVLGRFGEYLERLGLSPLLGVQVAEHLEGLHVRRVRLDHALEARHCLLRLVVLEEHLA